MQLARFLNSVFKNDGFILVDANSKNYIIGSPKKDKPIKVKILDKKLHYKLLLHPDLYFGEAYTNGDIIIENGSLSEFLDLALMNFGRNELNFFSYLINRLRGSYRYLTNFNFIKKSKMNVSHHYDISDDLYDLFLDPKRQYSCAYFKKETDTLEEASFFLGLVCKSKKPVVLTAAMRPGNFLSADGPANLFHAVLAATSPELRHHGLIVVMNGMVIPGWQIIKTDSMALDSFHFLDYLYPTSFSKGPQVLVKYFLTMILAHLLF